MIRVAALIVALASVMTIKGQAMAETRVSHLPYDALAGWAEDDHEAALAVFRNTCAHMRDADWKPLCALAERATDARAFFELLFKPVLIEDGKEMLFTGYFEPELRGSRFKSPAFPYPLYRFPDAAETQRPYLTRRQIEETGALEGQGLEIAWIDDPVDVFFLQIQGSGRVRLDDGTMLRVGYGGSNGHPYSSVGQVLIEQGIFAPHQVSAKVIRNWVRENPEEGAELLRRNASYVFFREVSEVPAEKGPLGAMNLSITPLRSLAVDPSIVPLGAPIWIEKQGSEPLARLMIAQDTGSAIKGAQRADIFYGTGADAGDQAGRVRDGGRMVVLMPIQRAYAMLPPVLE